MLSTHTTCTVKIKICQYSLIIHNHGVGVLRSQEVRDIGLLVFNSITVFMLNQNKNNRKKN